MYTVTLLLALLILWASIGNLDIVASAEGKLVPESYVKLVQPAVASIVKEILVHEGERVTAGQVNGSRKIFLLSVREIRFVCRFIAIGVVCFSDSQLLRVFSYVG